MIKRLLFILVGVQSLWAQTEYPEAISDNSFMLEEAYNQEARVVQHISGLIYTRPSKDWEYGLTQEWPMFFLPHQEKHQLSYTLPYQWLHNGPSGFGDVAVNYRYQWMADPAGYNVSPRFTVLLPTGDDNKGLGSGKMGYQIGLPVSKRLSAQWAAHVNVGMTMVPGVDVGSKKKIQKAYNIGASAIWLVKSNLNVFVEYVSVFEDEVDGTSLKNKGTHIINPGFCFAREIGSMQVVPGLSVPLQLNGSSKTKQIFVYLSMEHPF